MRSLYISYFGLQEPLIQTQVLPYLRELAATGVQMFLRTFESKRWDHEHAREQLRADGIEWVALRYHKRPTLPATLYDVVTGALRTISLVRKHRIDVIHARSYVPALIGAIAKRFTHAKLIFDIRGLMADEYVEGGRWKRNGFLYRVTKAVERFLFRSSDAFVILTERGRQAILPVIQSKPIEVIPCCIDPARFASADRDRIRAELGATDRIILVYAGSLGGSYPVREMAEFFAAAKACDPRVFPLILTHSNADALAAHLSSLGMDFHITYADPSSLPSYLAAADAGLSMVRPGYSKIAMSPTKFAEYLGSGLPVLSTRGIGDLDEQIERERVGVLLDGFDADSYRAAFRQLERLRAEEGVRERCARLAVAAYDLASVGAARYRRLYARLMELDHV